MPQKRGKVVAKVDTGQMIPDIYENWLKKQVEARSGSTGKQAAGLVKQREEDKEEDEIETAEDVHEKAHRRKRGKTTR